jgi:hypothetical protein
MIICDGPDGETTLQELVDSADTGRRKWANGPVQAIARKESDGPVQFLFGVVGRLRSAYLRFIFA